MIDDQQIRSSHLIEIRHRARGAFIDQRGRIADAIATSTDLRFWNISDARLDFRLEEKSQQEQGFASHNNVGYQVRNPATRNYFRDRTLRYLNSLLAVEGYELPPVLRFGVRVHAYLRSRLTFDRLLERVNERFPLGAHAEPYSATIVDVGPVLVMKRGATNLRVRYGPLSVEEADRLFKSLGIEDVPGVGFYADIDQWQVDLGQMSTKQVSALLGSFDDAAWEAVSRYANALE